MSCRHQSTCALKQDGMCSGEFSPTALEAIEEEPPSNMDSQPDSEVPLSLACILPEYSLLPGYNLDRHICDAPEHTLPVLA